MAINYATLFARLGVLTAETNEYLARQATKLNTSGSGADKVLDQFDAARTLVDGIIQSGYEKDADRLAGFIDSTLKKAADAVFADLQNELGASSSNPSAILPMLRARMVIDGESVQQNTIATPTVTAAGTNTGDMTLRVSKQDVYGVDDDRILVESVRVECISDRFDGVASGAERFRLNGYRKLAGSKNWITPALVAARGNGGGPTLTVASGANLLTNGSFDTQDATGFPTGWLLQGAAGVDFLQVPSTWLPLWSMTPAAILGGLSLMVFADGTKPSYYASQNIASVVAPLTKYGLGCFARRLASIAGGSNLQIAVKGTGFSTVNLFNADPSTLTTSYALKDAFFSTGATIPTDLRIEIAWTGTPAAKTAVLIDEMQLTAAVEFGHAFYAMFRGATAPIRGDYITVATSNNYAGVFQTWLGRFYDERFAASGSPTRADSLAA